MNHPGNGPPTNLARNRSTCAPAVANLSQTTAPENSTHLVEDHHLDDFPSDGEHRQATVLDLSELQPPLLRS